MCNNVALIGSIEFSFKKMFSLYFVADVSLLCDSKPVRGLMQQAKWDKEIEQSI